MKNNSLRRMLIGQVVTWRQRWLAAFRESLKDPQIAQQRQLRAVLRQISGSTFARDHNIDERRLLKSQSLDRDWRQQLSIAGHERVASYVTRVGEGETKALFRAGTRLHMFAMTSGTTAPAKLIPVTDLCLADYRRTWSIWGSALAERYPELPHNKVMSLASDWRVRQTSAGIPCGSITGLLVHVMHRTLRVTNALPPEIVMIHDTTARHYLSLKLGLAHDNLMMLTTASPSTLVNLGRQLGNQTEFLLRDLHDGGISSPEVRETLSTQQVRQVVAAVKQRQPQRAKELEAALRGVSTLTPEIAWPRLAALAVWTGGSLTPYLPRLKPFYGDLPLHDHGLSASEGRMTIPLDLDGGVLNIHGPYFEFIEEHRYGEASPPTLMAHELTAGGQYYLVVSTTGGLCRYDMADLVRCTGFVHATPVLKFLNKASHIANLTGEKLSAFQVAAALRLLVQHMGGEISGSEEVDLALAPIAGAGPDDLPHYGLLVERNALALRPHWFSAPTIAKLDHDLGEQNIEYAEKRRSHRLGPVQVQAVPDGTWSRLRAERLHLSGGMIEQYKHPFLLNDAATLNKILVQTKERY